MDYKMRVLFFSTSGNAERIAQELSREYRCTSDKIPPAYPCENEKLLIIGLEGCKKADTQVLSFCKNLNPNRAKNVAFFVVGNHAEGVEALKEAIKQNGLGVAGETYLCPVKSGLFKQGRVSDVEVANTKKWADEVTASLIAK